MKIANWGYLVVGIIAITAFAGANKMWGKWLFSLVIVSALLLASNKLANRVTGN